MRRTMHAIGQLSWAYIVNVRNRVVVLLDLASERVISALKNVLFHLQIKLLLRKRVRLRFQLRKTREGILSDMCHSIREDVFKLLNKPLLLVY